MAMAKRRSNPNQGDLFADAEAPRQLTIDGREEFARTLRNEHTAAADRAREARFMTVT